ncbi:hypothetical protein EVAR_47339_1 [Eumeta japonica]|uniref:DNA helicase Pif1-like 2B domain-containing protein n=1 Tax=Eumeta variegata TaxID=151549 RepID=A0A4C1WUC0_EUMVA|nr:hypothetical protein EVAR_47339_1 [Eumeta japonica]
MYPELDGMLNVPAELCSVVTTVKDLIKKCPDIALISDKHLEWLRELAILTPKNDQVALINDLLLESFQGKEIIYYSIDTVVNTDKAVYYPVEFLNTVNPADLPYDKLSLGVGIPVMLLWNIKPPK